MIPKLIHFFWLSGEPLPPQVSECLSTWKENCPDYTIKKWTYDDVKEIDSHFLQEALASRKWAFATDFLRFYAVFHYGGIYLDSDIYLYKPLDIFLDSDGFTFLEGSNHALMEGKKKKLVFGLEAACFGAEKGSPWIKSILDYYADKAFINDPKYYMGILAPQIMWQQTLTFGLREVYSFQLLKGGVKIFPMDILSCVYDRSLYGSDYHDYGKVNPLKYGCHLCANSWGAVRKEKYTTKMKNLIIKVIGKESAVRLKRSILRKR